MMEELIPNHTELMGGQSDSTGGYVDLDDDGSWWVPSGRSFYSQVGNDDELVEARNHFFVVRRRTDPFWNIAIANYDTYDLLPNRVVDPVGNTTEAQIDYRILKPFLVTDPNGHRSQCAFDELGFVIGTAVMGEVTENLGDSLDDF